MTQLRKKMLSATYFADEKSATDVKNYKRSGCSDKFIADALGITIKQLKDNYPYEMDMTDADDLAIVANVAFNMASSGEDAGMTKWWLTVKGGWMYREQKPTSDPLQIILDSDEDEEDEMGIISDQ